MKTVKLFSAAAVLSAVFASFGAHAGVTTDAHGNVGYDTAEECDAAVLAGTAKFYETFTHKSPLIRKGEKSVTTAKVSDLGAEYARGACDLGVGRKLGRDGVSTPLQGKYVPFSPDMPINVYLNAEGKAVRVSMAQCDNWFSGDAPRAVQIPAAPVAKEEAPIVEAVAPVIAVPAVAKSFGVRPYVFGTLGALNDSMKDTPIYDNAGNEILTLKDNDTRFAGQVGLGLQFNKYLGAEAFYQGASKHKFSQTYTAVNNNENKATVGKIANQTYGARLTVGKNFTDNFRLFGKVGAAAVKHKFKDTQLTITDPTGTVIANVPVSNSAKARQTRVTAGLGATYNFNENFAARVDYDHYFKKGKKDTFSAANYLGAGLQYKF